MTDIVERLRTENTLTGYYGPPQLQEEAAAEIERLREALATSCGHCGNLEQAWAERDAARADAALAIELLNACVEAHETGKYDAACAAIERVRAALAAKEPGHE